ncbi:MAG: hypothetical protein REI45_01375, partial [Propionicimonas sp.]|nr:hypothetical protein [Propionicimonas sp.]
FLGGLFDCDRSIWFPMLVVVDEAQLFAPVMAGEASDEARRLSAELATDAYSRVKPVLRDAQIRGARLASDAYGRVQPTLDDALSAVSPAVGQAVGKVRPVVDDVLVRIPPLVEGARSRVQDDVLPKLAGALKDAAAQPLAAEAAAQLALATAVVSKELRKTTKAARKRSWPKTLGKIVLAGAILAGVVVAIRKLITPPSEGWHAHSPSDAYVADPIADAADKVGEAAGNLSEAVSQTADAAAAAAAGLAEDAGEVASDVAETAGDALGDLAEDAGELAEDLAEEASDAAEEAAETLEDLGETDDGEGDDASPLAGSPFGEESYEGSEPPEGFVVKANSRTRKFRVPGSSGYERATADVWFTSAEAAQAAGFAQAQR